MQYVKLFCLFVCFLSYVIVLILFFDIANIFHSGGRMIKRKKIVLYKRDFEDNEGLDNHYKIYHNVEEDNFFQKRSIRRNKSFVPNSFPGCDQFLGRAKEMKIHWKNFAGHYRDGKTYPFENKPVIDSRFIGLVLYIITYEVHKNFYNLFGPVAVIKFFFNAFKQRFVPSGKNVQKKSTFSIINFQSRRQKV